MKPPPTKLRRSDRTRAAILEAARLLFAQDGYERTTIRKVAAAARIDPSMVMRYFGSKDGLFAAANSFDLNLPDFSGIPRQAIGEALVRHFLSQWEGAQANRSLCILLRSAASNEAAARRLREIFATQLVPMVARISGAGGAERRAGLMVTQFLGLAFCRYVLALPPVAALEPEDLMRFIAPTIQQYIDS